jgi:hypothetical protein
MSNKSYFIGAFIFVKKFPGFVPQFIVIYTIALANVVVNTGYKFLIMNV